MAEPIITIENLGKRYRLGQACMVEPTFGEAVYSTLSRMARPWRRNTGHQRETFGALRHLSFQLHRGLRPLPQSDQAVREHRNANVMRMAQQARSWALHAIDRRELRIARRHAWTVLRHDLLNLESWRILRWAIRG